PRSGFSMKSNAPAFIAAMAMGTVPCPVMKMVGICQPRALISCCRSRPVIPGILMSRTRQPPRCASYVFRKSPAEAKVSTRCSAARKRKVSPLRTASSSSMTKTVLSKGGKGFFRDRQIEGETGAALARGDQAQMPALRLDDRAADRETHAHPVGFGRHERLEYLAP